MALDTKTLPLLLVLAAAPPASPADRVRSEPTEEPSAIAGRIINGLLDWGSPSVGFFVNPRAGGISSCSGTLIGCRTFVTAAHCVCADFGSEPFRVLPGAACRERPDLLDPSEKRVFFQHAGMFGVEEVTVHPEFRPGTRSDLAVLRLDRPVTGVRASRLDETGRAAVGSPGTLVGFGRTGAARNDRGLKRDGHVTLAPCARAPAAFNLCYDYRPPLGPPGTDSGPSGGDSGGPLFLDLGEGPRLAGVTSGGTPISSTALNNFSTDAFVERSWIASVAGADLHATDCGTLPFAGESGSSILFGSGALSAAAPEARFTLEVPPDTAVLRVGLNAEFPFTSEYDLYLARAAPPTPAVSDCASRKPGVLELCEVASPEPGTWHLLARRAAGEGELQVTATLFRADATGGPGEPAPPPGPWLAAPGLPGFEVKVRINGTTLGALEAACIAETLCASGALPGRPEVFVKVIGPRPNGYLWTQISRFTPSRVEVWVRELSAGQVNYYELPAVGAADDDVSGLQDREAFAPALPANP